MASDRSGSEAQIKYARIRREGRERAVELAYEAEIRGLSVEELIATLPLAPQEFAEKLLRQSERHQERSNELITLKATGWTMARMARMDVVIMRIAISEMLESSAPTGVVLAEAVDLASRYSTDESGPFVNGLLAAIGRHLKDENR